MWLSDAELSSWSPAQRKGRSGPGVHADDGLKEIESGSVFNMVDSSSTDRLKEIHGKRRIWRMWPWLLAASLLLIPQLPRFGVPDAVAQTLVVVGLAATPSSGIGQAAQHPRC